MKKSSFIYQIMTLVTTAVLLVIVSCQKKDAITFGPENVRSKDKLELFFNDTAITLKQENQTSIALVLNWNESNKATIGSSSYKLLIDKDSSFKSAYSIVSQPGVFSTSFTTKALNTLATETLGIPADSTKKFNLYLKVIAITNLANDTSATYSVTIVPYVKHFIVTKELYIIGTAVGTLLNPQVAIPMYADSSKNVPSAFYWVGYITDTGSFKFITSPALGLYPSYSKGFDNNHLSYHEDKPPVTEAMLTVPTPGVYSITVHLLDSTIEMHVVEKLPILDADKNFVPGVSLIKDSVYTWIYWQALFDGDKDSYLDDAYGPTRPWGSLVFDTAINPIALIRYMPHQTDWAASRMIGGEFQGANTPSFSDSISLFTVTATPKLNEWNYASINIPKKFKYVRYIAPANSGINVAEIEYYQR